MNLVCEPCVALFHHLLDLNSSLFQHILSEILVFRLPLSLRILADLLHDVCPQATLPRPLGHLNDPDGLLPTQEACLLRLREI